MSAWKTEASNRKADSDLDLLDNMEIRVHADTALPTGAQTATIKETDNTWSLMMHMSESLGENCVICHNSRAFNDWDQSPPQRVTAWHGIRMTRQLNTEYMVELTPLFPDDGHHLGPQGDVLKIGCNTCHQGVQKPLYGASMMDDYRASLGDISSGDYELCRARHKTYYPELEIMPSYVGQGP